MELGDKVAKVTDTLGIKKCEGCKKRQSLLNEAGRRGFIKGAVFLVGYATISTQKVIAQTIVKPDTSLGLIFERAINVANAGVNPGDSPAGTPWATKAQVLEHLAGEIKRHAKTNEDTQSEAWARSLNLTAPNIMPGWNWDYFVGPNGYVSIIKGIASDKTEKRPIYITDETGVIYRTDLAGDVPAASTVGHAATFPGAAPFNEVITKERTTWFYAFLNRIGVPTTVLAQGTGSCKSCCQYYYGNNIGSHDGSGCDTIRPYVGYTGFNCGGDSGCTWCWAGRTPAACCTCCDEACGCGGGGCANCRNCCGAPCYSC